MAPKEQTIENKFKAWIEAKTGSGFKCKPCGSESYQVFTYYQNAIGVDPATGTQVPSIPLLQVVCDGCANVRFFVANWIVQ